MSKNGRSGIKAAIFLPLVTLGLFSICFLMGMVSGIPARAEQIFGPPSPSLGMVRLYYQSSILILQSEQLTSPANPQGGMISFTILPGTTPDEIISQLKDAGLIKSSSLFRTYLIYTGLDTSIQAGEYSLSQTMSAVEIAQALQDAAPEETTFVILAGWRAEEVAEALPSAGVGVSPEVFMAEVKAHSAEGKLFPAAYQFSRSASAAEIVAIFQQEFERQVGLDMQKGAEKQGFSLEEVVVLASIVEREAVVAEEMPMIASVFVNRLRADMALGADPTVQYALGYNKSQGTWWTNPLSAADMEVVSPYNTYRNLGLPPGPICNPSLLALEAVAFPAQTPYYYFRAACDGSGRHLFSETYEEHISKGCQ